MQALRATEHTSQRLYRYANNIIQGLLDCQRDASGLCVETHLQRALVCGTEAIAHCARPNSTSGAILGNLFKKVIVRVEEERNARYELIDVQACAHTPLDVFDPITQRESQLLHRRGA